jgi:hypothetical protein
MPRFLLPAFCMVAAMVILLAGAFGDLPSWRGEWPGMISRIGGVLDAAGQSSPPPRSQAETVHAQDTDLLRRRTQDLQAQIAQETADLAALRAAAVQARRDLASLREQRQREQAAPATTDAAPRAAYERRADARPAERPADARPDERRADAQLADRATPEPSADPIAGPPTVDRAASSRGDQSVALATPPVAVPVPAPVAAVPSVPDPAALPRVDPERGVMATQTQTRAVRVLMSARRALAMGRRARARRLLVLARSEMTPPAETSEQSAAATGNPQSGQLGHAIGLIDSGDRDGALRTVDQVLVSAGADLTVPPHLTRQDHRRGGG